MREAMDLTLNCQCANTLPELVLHKIHATFAIRSRLSVLYLIQRPAQNANGLIRAFNAEFPEVGFVFRPTEHQNTLNSRVFQAFSTPQQDVDIDFAACSKHRQRLSTPEK